MATLDIRDFHSLDELRGNLLAYVNRYNHPIHSSLKGKTPQERFFSEPERICRLSDEAIHQNFLVEIERRVSVDSVIVIEQAEYEVDCRFAKQRIRLLNKQEDTFVKNSKEIVIHTNEYKEVLFRLDYLAKTKGFGLLTGSSGKGKTTTVRNWAASLNPSLYKVVYSSFTTLTTNDFYRNLVTGFGAQPT